MVISMFFNLTISGVLFHLDLDEDVYQHFLTRVPANSSKDLSFPNVTIFCKRVNQLHLTNTKFLSQQEPDISELSLYREIFGVGTFKYNRINKHMDCYYVINNQYPYNAYEVVVDTILQFIYLIMLDYNVTPLHVSVVSYHRKAILIFGNSGSGKSTLELALLSSGFDFFSDDVAFYDMNGRIYSSGESIIAFNLSTNQLINSTFKERSIIPQSFITIRKSPLEKHIITMIPANQHYLVPHLLLFPVHSNDMVETLEQIPANNALTRLIKLSISSGFSSSQKQQYLYQLRKLVDSTSAFQYSWTSNSTSNLLCICNRIKKNMMLSEICCYDK